MRNMERQNFEDSWKKAFEEAEVNPSDSVWTNVELDLERAQGSKLKKRLAIFQLLAAAAVIFSVGLGVGVYLMKGSYENSANELALQLAANAKLNEELSRAKDQMIAKNQEQPFPQTSTTLIESDDKTSTITSATHSSATSPGRQIASTYTTPESVITEADNTVDHSTVGVFGGDRENLSTIADNSLMPSLVENRPIKLSLPSQKKEEVEVDPVQLMLAKLDQREREIAQVEEQTKAKPKEGEKLWTSVGFAAGSFSATNAGVSNRQAPPVFEQNRSIANTEAKASGVSYTIGASIGTKLSERWVFQGGVNYLSQSSDYTANSAVLSSDAASFTPASINELQKFSSSAVPAEEKLVSTMPYNVNNNLRYLSIPMQAGYMVINKNFGLQLNAGVATDLFLQNTVSADGGNLDRTKQEIGENSPYRSVNLSGLAGTELSYRFSRKYRIALNPGLRYPLSSIYKSELAVKANPITFDIGLRFRYIFH